MAENTKFDVLLSEINSMESQVLVLTNKWKDTYLRNKELEEQALKLKKENYELLQSVSRLEEELEKLKKFQEENPGILQGEHDSGVGLFNTLNAKERENLKIKLQNLISRIDYHLSADNSR